MITDIRKLLSNKAVFILLGIFNIFLFHYTIYRLWFFLYESSGRVQYSSIWQGILVNLILIALFSVPHSLLLRSKTKLKLGEYIPKGLYYTFYSLHACISLFLMDHFWADLQGDVYLIEGKWKLVFNGLYALSWSFMTWAIVSAGIFRQSGIEQWWKSLRDRNYREELPTKGAYHVCRHPIYAAFLGMLWTTPNLSYDRILLNVIWTGYIFMGIYFKEKRLAKNTDYQRYSQVVPALPFLTKQMDSLFARYLGVAR